MTAPKTTSLVERQSKAVQRHASWSSFWSEEDAKVLARLINRELAAALRELPEELCNSIANYFDPDEETERAIGNAVADWLEKEAQK